MKFSTKVRSPLLALLLLASASASGAQNPEGIILVVGDGLSTELLTAARVYASGAQGALALEKFPHTAFVRTYSANNVVTDSAAGATALARGVKVPNGRVGLSADQSPAPQGLLDIARSSGWTTAVVSDDSVTGATPASFMVDHPTRNESHQIASKILDVLGSRVDVVLGGGRMWFGLTELADHNDPTIAPVVALNKQKIQDAGINVFTDWKTFTATQPIPSTTPPVLGLFSDDAMAFIADGNRTPRLLDMVQAALAILHTADKPYLLIVEAALPDKAAHQNQAKRALEEVLEMDAVLGWLDTNLGPNVLILATTDHATGGLALNGYLPLTSKGDVLLVPNPATGVPTLSWATGPGGPDPDSSKQSVSSTDPDAQQPAAAYTKYANHTGGDVWLIGRGPGSAEVHGFLDNTDVFRILSEALTASPRPLPKAKQ